MNGHLFTYVTIILKSKYSGCSSPDPYLTESQNYYLRARYLNTQDGRFLSTDPFEGRMAEPITLNDYIYAGNNPVIYVDPSGEFFGGLASISFSTTALNLSGYSRIASTVEQGAVTVLYARTVVMGIHMREDALQNIYAIIFSGGFSQQEIQSAYEKYDQATRFMSMVTGTAERTFQAFTYMQAATSFAKGLTKIPIATYSEVPFKYQAITNTLNHKVIVEWKNV